MIDINKIRNHPEAVKFLISLRGKDDARYVDLILETDQNLREIRTAIEQARAAKNRLAKEMGRLKKEGLDTTDNLAKSKEIGELIDQYEPELKQMEQDLENILIQVPNIPHESCPIDVDLIPHWALEDIVSGRAAEYLKPYYLEFPQQP